jgi:hypothetical protein
VRTIGEARRAASVDTVDASAKSYLLILRHLCNRPDEDRGANYPEDRKSPDSLAASGSKKRKPAGVCGGFSEEQRIRVRRTAALQLCALQQNEIYGTSGAFPTSSDEKFWLG